MTGWSEERTEEGDHNMLSAVSGLALKRHMFADLTSKRILQRVLGLGSAPLARSQCFLGRTEFIAEYPQSASGARPQTWVHQ